MKAITVFFALFFLLTSTNMVLAVGDMSVDEGHHENGLKLGRYVGELVVPSKNKKVMATLDLFVIQEGKEFPKLNAILKTYLGGFFTPEYISSFYDKVMFDPDKMELTFDFQNQDIMISSMMIHGSHLMGNFRSVSSSINGTMSLNFQRSFDLKNNHVNNSIFLEGNQYVDALSGEYKATCEGLDNIIQIEVNRTLQESPKINHSYGQYDIKGRLSKGNSNVRDIIFQSGAYNFYSGELFLYGLPTNLQCTVQNNKLVCGQCSYRKLKGLDELFVKSNTAPFYNSIIKIDEAGFDDLPTQLMEDSLSGQYYGHLFNESTNKYQTMRFDVTAFRNREGMHSPNQLYIATTANLYFGNFESIERITLKFNNRQWLTSEGGMLVGENSESFGIIRQWKNDLIVMDWYSKNYGRVGTAQLVRGEIPLSPQNINLISAVSGRYQNAVFQLEISAGPSSDSSVEVFNSFHPLSLSGFFHLSGTAPLSKITRGAYDFYSGYFWIEGPEESKFVGIIDQNFLKLFFTGIESVLAVPIMQWEFVEYHRVE